MWSLCSLWLLFLPSDLKWILLSNYFVKDLPAKTFANILGSFALLISIDYINTLLFLFCICFIWFYHNASSDTLCFFTLIFHNCTWCVEPFQVSIIQKKLKDDAGLIFEIHLIFLNNIYYLNEIVYQYLHPCDIGTHPPDLKTVAWICGTVFINKSRCWAFYHK